MNLIAKVKRNLVNLSDKEFDQYFASITNRYLPGDTKAIELSNDLIEYFTKEYDISFLLHGIRDADRNILLPKLKENDTKAIWYRIYKPNSICGLPHRDADFWAVDDLPIVPEGNFSRIKFWMPILGCCTTNSLRIWPKSHLRQLKSSYTIEGNCPFISKEDIQNIGDYIVPSSAPGEYILFDDLTVHHGPKNTNTVSDGFRISLETTLLLESKK